MELLKACIEDHFFSVDHNLVVQNMNLLITAGFAGDLELAKNTCLLLQQGVPAKKQVRYLPLPLFLHSCFQNFFFSFLFGLCTQQLSCNMKCLLWAHLLSLSLGRSRLYSTRRNTPPRLYNLRHTTRQVRHSWN